MYSGRASLDGPAGGGSADESTGEDLSGESCEVEGDGVSLAEEESEQ